MSVDILFFNIPGYLFMGKFKTGCSRGHGDISNPFAIVVKKEDIVGHVPKQISCASSLFLQIGGLLACKVSVDRC